MRATQRSMASSPTRPRASRSTCDSACMQPTQRSRCPRGTKWSATGPRAPYRASRCGGVRPSGIDTSKVRLCWQHESGFHRQNSLIIGSYHIPDIDCNTSARALPGGLAAVASFWRVQGIRLHHPPPGPRALTRMLIARSLPSAVIGPSPAQRPAPSNCAGHAHAKHGTALRVLRHARGGRLGRL
jgi:hypothetical protein